MRQIYRRVCLLRARGRIAEAAAIERTELVPALASAREHAGEIDEGRLRAEEAERVASAQLLAELIAPLVAECLRPTAQPTTVAHPLAASAPTVAPRPQRPATGAVPSIADLIDGMLSQQGAPPSPVAT